MFPGLTQWQNTLISIAIICVAAFVIALIVDQLVKRLIDVSIKSAQKRPTLPVGRGPATVDNGRTANRINTLGQALKLVANWVIAIIAVFMVLHELGVNTAPLLASAGVGGIAFGLGAQSLIKDIIGGVFIIFEDQFGVGDFVIIGALKGTVLNIGTRVTQVQDGSGAVWYVRNGEISTLGNQSQGWSSAFISFPVALSEDPFKAIKVLETVVSELDNDPVWHDQMLESPLVQGLVTLDSAEMVLQVQIKCPATKQGDVERELRARALLALQNAGIKTPRITTP